MVDPTPPATPPDPFAALLASVRDVVPCDAAALLRLDGDVLTPVAIHGLGHDTLGRRFPVAAHPRLQRLLASPGALRFPPDCGLPDPYDGLVAGQPAMLPVHDCLGTPLQVGGRRWGLLTLDALAPGALDAVTPARLDALARLLERGIDAALREHDGEEPDAQAEAAATQAWRAARAARGLVGTSAAMQRLRDEIDTVAGAELSVLLVGETGVGKDLVAQRLHQASRRAARPLVQVNCAALPETLADTELFGHKRGAFTGALQDRAGKFELADGGTLFLDEVGELPLAVQAKLLRVLQTGEVQRPGSDRVVRVDVRVFAATNRDLPAAIAEGRFRADLYHHLAVFPLTVPPLRDRGRDVLALAGGFLEENQHRLAARNLRLSPAAKAALLAHDWPGNVRELEHVLSRAALRAAHAAGRARSGRWIAIEPAHLGLGTAAAGRPGAEAGRSAAVALHAAPGPAPDAGRADRPPGGEGGGLAAATAAFQRAWLLALLERHGGRLAAAAREAGMDRSNFHRLLRRLGLLPAGTDGARRAAAAARMTDTRAP